MIGSFVVCRQWEERFGEKAKHMLKKDRRERERNRVKGY